MKIKGKTKEFEIITCNHFKSRFLGNMGKKRIENVLLFPRCNSIHTFFMREAIDVVMIDSKNTVLYCYSNLKPWKILWPKKGVSSTLEFPKGENIYQINDILTYKKEL